jgi:hypothetical protein
LFSGAGLRGGKGAAARSADTGECFLTTSARDLVGRSGARAASKYGKKFGALAICAQWLTLALCHN